MTKYSKLEKHIIERFNSCEGLTWESVFYTDIEAYKPVTEARGGECKTDVYVKLSNDKGDETALKISVKKSDADFEGNKLLPEAAEGLLGKEWQSILIKNINSIKQRFLDESIFTIKTDRGFTDNYFTLGWKLEVANKWRNLSVPLPLPKKQIIDKVFRGTVQPEKRKHAKVNEKVIVDSGIADYRLTGDIIDFSDVESILSKMIDFYDYTPPDIYLIFTGFTYRLIANKTDGARGLAVAVEWQLEEDKIKPVFVFDKPLFYRGSTHMLPILKQSLESVGVPLGVYHYDKDDPKKLFDSVRPLLLL